MVDAGAAPSSVDDVLRKLRKKESKREPAKETSARKDASFHSTIDGAGAAPSSANDALWALRRQRARASLQENIKSPG